MLEDSAVFAEPAEFDRKYQLLYRKFVKFLYANPKFSFAFSFSGPQLAYYSRNYPEFIDILHQMVLRKQVELLGGGYYNPLFPLLLPQDRSGQIEMLTALVRDISGSRPKGIVPAESAWDFTMITQMNTCGIEYAMLDCSVMPASAPRHCPLVVSYQGRTSVILPVRDALLKDAGDFDSFMARVIADVPAGSADSAVVTVRFAPADFARFVEAGWFVAAAQSDAQTVRPFDCIKSSPEFVPVFLQSAVRRKDGAHGGDCSVFDLLHSRPEGQALYNRMLYISRLLEHCKVGDKARRNEAKRKLWKAQSALFYSFADTGPAYSYLADAEKILQELSGFRPNLADVDYNGDRIREYLCRADSFSAVVQRRGGVVSELNVLPVSVNYVSVRYGALFEDSVRFLEDGCVVPFCALYSETKYDAHRRCVRLMCQQDCGSRGQALALVKHIALTAIGFQVQYIIRNRSDSALSARFQVGFAFGSSRCAEGLAVEHTQAFAQDDAVSAVLVADADNGVRFLLEPNEGARLWYERDTNSVRIELGWDMELASGMEMEKTINLAIAAGRR